jgi:uncharacterized protein YndB with AHSA1/START domain
MATSLTWLASGAFHLTAAPQRQVGSDTLRLERSFPASRDQVFHAWIDEEAVKEWFLHDVNGRWSPDSEPKIDARPGGHFRWGIVDDKGESFQFHGTYQRLRSKEEIAFTWKWDSLPIPGIDGPGNTRVVIEFSEQGGATKMVLAQSGFPNRAARDAHEKGWTRCLNGIAVLLDAKGGGKQ